MSDVPYSLRLGRAILLIAIGVALHLPRPWGITFPVPQIHSLPPVSARAELQTDQPAIAVEYSDVLARQVSELDGKSTRQPRDDTPVGTTGARPADPRGVAAAPTGVVAVDRNVRNVSNVEPRAAAAVDGNVRVTNAVPSSDESDGPDPLPIESDNGRPPVSETAPAVATPISEEHLVRQLIDQYTGALERLDVGAAQAVWPTVDGKALKRAFGHLSAQRLTVESCGITISGSTANARCRGSATYRPRIGPREVQIASMEWKFDLSKEDTAWRIVNTVAR